jgi:hexosaminidase
MKLIISYIFLLLFFCSSSSGQQVICPIIPLPNAAESTGKNFRLDNNTAILVNNEALLPLAHYLQTELLSKFGLTLIVQKKSHAPAIILELNTKHTGKPEAHQLKMEENHVQLIAGNTNGIFNGIVSLLQLVGAAPVKNNAFELACWNIADAPRYAWRGLMLDESRHFFGKDKVKSILDWMAFYKLNKFHWHLTDMPGWRLEIKRYPKLTTVGGIGSFSNANAPTQSYTQKDILEIVAYAKERFITVIPEVDMPGHASAANRAYPEFNGGGTAQLPDFTFNPGKEGTYQYLSHILKETAVLFPARMIHLGADEVNYGNRAWETDVHVQQLQQSHKLADRKAVEQYFIRRMADSVIKLHRKVLVWDEAADAGLDPKETIVFWWRQDKPEQLKLALDKGFPVVLCPRLPLYFDFVQDSIHRIGRKGKNGEYNGLADVYHFSHEKVPVIGDQGKLIEGIQADIWTESISGNRRLDFMLFPRIAALAEAAWTDTKQKNYEQFKQRLKPHLQLYRAAGIYYYDPFAPFKNSEPDHINKNTTTGYID